MEPHQNLASAVIKQAVVDLKKVNSNIKKYEKLVEKQQGVDCTDEFERLVMLKARKGEVLGFFKSNWCEGLCDIIGLDSAVVKEAMMKLV